MFSLYEGQITDLMPWKIAQSTEVRCISYAVQQEHQRMLRLAAHTRTCLLYTSDAADEL